MRLRRRERRIGGLSKRRCDAVTRSNRPAKVETAIRVRFARASLGTVSISALLPR